MGKKDKQNKKTKHWPDRREQLPKKDRSQAKLTKVMHQALLVAKINSQTWHEMEGALSALQRLAMLKSQDTAHRLNGLHRMAKHYPSPTDEAHKDRMLMINTLQAQYSQWDKIEGTIQRAKCLSHNEDVLLRGPWQFQGQELGGDEQPILHT